MLPLVRPKQPLLEKIKPYFDESCRTGKLTNFGPSYQKLVDRLSVITDRYNVPCANGTAAIQICAQVAFPHGSRILCPDYTHIGTLQALTASGMRPIFGSCDSQSWTLDAKLILEHADSFDGFVVVSPFGYRVDFNLYDSLSEKLNKPVIYDLAGGFGMVVPTTNPVSFSMHATKNLCVGEGGISSFSSSREASVAMQLSCFDQNVDRSIRSPYGNNLKIDELRCAMALAVLDDYQRLEARTQRIKDQIDIYQEALKDHCIVHDLHRGNAAPSLCVLGGLFSNVREIYFPFEVKQYYPLLSDMVGLRNIPTLGAEKSSWSKLNFALPTDVTKEESDMVIESILKAIK